MIVQSILKIFVRVPAVASVLLLAACGAHSVGHSGFLGDYSQLTADVRVDGAERYEKVGVDVRQYEKFIIDPVVIRFAPKAEGINTPPEDLLKLANYFHTELTAALNEEAAVVTSPDHGVMRIRIAITDVSKSIPVLNVHPGTRLTGVGLGGASMEAEVLDAMTGERLGAVVESQQGNRLFMLSGLSEYGHAEQVIDDWIERFIDRLKEEKAKVDKA